MSFFEEGDEPRRTAGGSRRAARPDSGAGGPSGTDRPPDSQTLLIRRAAALAGGVLVLILLVVFVNSCRQRAEQQSLRDYNGEVAGLIRESDEQVGNRLFEVLGGRGEEEESSLDLESEVNQLRVVAGEHVDRGRAIGAPGSVRAAQRNLVTVLEFRRDGVRRIAELVPTALGQTGAGEAVEGIAAQMQLFLSSDVSYSQRVMPYIQQAFQDNDVTGEQVRRSQFLPDLEWLDPASVRRQLRAGGGEGEEDDEDVAPGLHGHGLSSVAVGDLTLQPGETANRIPAAADLTFTVTVQNQGENPEEDIEVSIRIEGAGSPIVVRDTLEATEAGQEATATIPLGQAPPIGTPVTIRVAVAGVPGEQMLDNNRQTYQAIFTR